MNKRSKSIFFVPYKQLLVFILLSFFSLFQFFSITILAAPTITSIVPSSGPITGGDTINITGTGFFPGIGNATGLNDATFTVGTGAQNIVYVSELDSSEKIIIGGQFTRYNGTARNRIARINTNGTLDTSFNPGTGANNTIFAIAIQSDGKILIGGQFSTYNGTTRNRIARVNTDGTLDATFPSTVGAGNTIQSIAIQPDGKILIGGQFTSYNGTARNRIARVNSDSTLDTGFAVGTGLNNTLNAITIQSDGQILIGGFFTTYNGTGRSGLARINTNGSIDTSFTVGTGIAASGTRYVYKILVERGGRIIITGSFTTYNGTTRQRVARINTNGTLDTTFNSSSGANNIVYAAAIQSDSKIIIGGKFTSYNGAARNRLARINANYTVLSSSIGGAPCSSATYISPTNITCIVPAVATVGARDVIVRDQYDDEFLSIGGYTYTLAINLAFQIRNSTDTANINTCDLGTATPSTFSTCSYRLKVSSQATNGYYLYVQTSGNLTNSSYGIANATAGTGVGGGDDISLATVGTEKYGAFINPGTITGGTVTFSSLFNTASTRSTLFNYASPQLVLETNGPNVPAATDTANTTLVTHNLNVSADTRGGSYTQQITYTVVPKF